MIFVCKEGRSSRSDPIIWHSYEIGIVDQKSPTLLNFGSLDSFFSAVIELANLKEGHLEGSQLSVTGTIVKLLRTGSFP